ncbi:hypothetical protein DFJ77DRAFT_440011 [Powellomyces hirtus]|nr:hypothetical protein DFJ77DRAFT_440011 [Powellomyces hirtus]
MARMTPAKRQRLIPGKKTNVDKRTVFFKNPTHGTFLKSTDSKNPDKEFTTWLRHNNDELGPYDWLNIVVALYHADECWRKDMETLSDLLKQSLPKLDFSQLEERRWLNLPNTVLDGLFERYEDLPAVIDALKDRAADEQLAAGSERHLSDVSRPPFSDPDLRENSCSTQMDCLDEVDTVSRATQATATNDAREVTLSPEEDLHTSDATNLTDEGPEYDQASFPVQETSESDQSPRLASLLLGEVASEANEHVDMHLSEALVSNLMPESTETVHVCDLVDAESVMDIFQAAETDSQNVGPSQTLCPTNMTFSSCGAPNSCGSEPDAEIVVTVEPTRKPTKRTRSSQQKYPPAKFDNMGRLLCFNGCGKTFSPKRPWNMHRHATNKTEEGVKRARCPKSPSD